jgi:hypothetical protein
VYRRVRDEAPVYHNAELGLWAISRHFDVLPGFRDNERLSNATGASPEPLPTARTAEPGTSFLAITRYPAAILLFAFQTACQWRITPYCVIA